MSKSVLMVVGLVVLLMGIAALVPSWTMSIEPAWHAWVKVIIGIIAMYVSATDKK